MELGGVVLGVVTVFEVAEFGLDGFGGEEQEEEEQDGGEGGAVAQGVRGPGVGFGGGDEPAVEDEEGGDEDEWGVGDVVAAVEAHDLGDGAEIGEDERRRGGGRRGRGGGRGGERAG